MLRMLRSQPLHNCRFRTKRGEERYFDPLPLHRFDDRLRSPDTRSFCPGFIGTRITIRPSGAGRGSIRLSIGSPSPRIDIRCLIFER